MLIFWSGWVVIDIRIVFITPLLMVCVDNFGGSDRLEYL